VIEKGGALGDHAISGAVMDPRALEELLPGFRDAGAPLESPVTEEGLFFFTKSRAIRIPFTPPPLRNHGAYIVSLGKLVPWMGDLCEKEGVNVFPGFPGAELLYDGERVIGVRTRDQGVDRKGGRKSNYQPGVDILAKVTVLGEGPRGTLTKEITRRLRLDEGKHPQVYSAGVKELWRIPPGRLKQGAVFHTMGHPLRNEEFGGGFIYAMEDTVLSVGFVTGLDYRDPTVDPHGKLQVFKTHPFVRRLLDGGELLSYGAKTIPEGGIYSMPRLFGDGFLIAGDSAGLLNSMRLKGIHLAIKSGMLAAETILDALREGDTSRRMLARYEERVNASWIRKELWSVRNFHQSWRHGLWFAMANAGLQILTGGRGLVDHMKTEPGHARMRKLREYFGPDGERWARATRPPEIAYDGKLTFDKVSDVFASKTMHEEDQPCHLVVADYDICNNRCREEYGNPCQYFCPANVYQIVETEGEGRHLVLSAPNCVHCKTCDVMDPYEIITWVPPEGGGGPGYRSL
jgi:electron-transferring-flavoprotein dehydrogenase